MHCIHNVGLSAMKIRTFIQIHYKMEKMESKEVSRVATCIIMHYLTLLQVREMEDELLSLISH